MRNVTLSMILRLPCDTGSHVHQLKKLHQQRCIYLQLEMEVLFEPETNVNVD